LTVYITFDVSVALTEGGFYPCFSPLKPEDYFMFRDIYSQNIYFLPKESISVFLWQLFPSRILSVWSYNEMVLPALETLNTTEVVPKV
jgi:hypothetical protein